MLNLPDLNAVKPKFVPLPILMSCRVRLNAEQRACLKAAYYEMKNKVEPKPSHQPGSTVRSVTVHNVDKEIGFSNIVFSDLVGSRESIPLNTLIHMQRTLKVEVIKPEDILKATEGYVQWVFNGRYENKDSQPYE